jgi:hypothetical protein
MPDKKALDKALNDKFISKDKFAEDIEKIVLNKQLSYIDAIVEYCSENEIELDTVNKLVSRPLKEKLKYEATQLNFLKKTSLGKLPV